MRFIFQLRLAVLLTIGVCALIGGAVEASRRMAQVKGLQTSLETFLAQPGKRGYAAPRLAGRKVVCVSLTAKDFDTAEYALPDAMRAATPEDVAAVVKIVRREVAVGMYHFDAEPLQSSATTGAFQQWADVIVIDKASGNVIAERSFAGSEPPRTSKSRTGDYGSRPGQEIVDWLTQI